VLRRAVRGMLPKNRLRDLRLERLKGRFRGGLRGWGGFHECMWLTSGTAVFEGENHPYKQNLVKMDGRTRIVQPDVSAEKLKAMSI